MKRLEIILKKYPIISVKLSEFHRCMHMSPSVGEVTNAWLWSQFLTHPHTMNGSFSCLFWFWLLLQFCGQLQSDWLHILFHRVQLNVAFIHSPAEQRSIHLGNVETMPIVCKIHRKCHRFILRARNHITNENQQFSPDFGNSQSLKYLQPTNSIIKCVEHWVSSLVDFECYRSADKNLLQMCRTIECDALLHTRDNTRASRFRHSK